ncbi:MAG TPA: PSD1 and planctomycete cytochrome C domain-containing protein, partial [Pyrinomonadaceae bacterium]|nr:PSD1 and planctomycete cytochrome C domain-containing protein [Pyrinomonadaceae bacterium]
MRRVNSVKLIAIAGVTLIVTCVYFLEPASTHPQDSSSQLTQQAAAILQSKCLQCHAEEKMSGLDLRTREGALKGGTRGTAIIPGDSAGSPLYRMVAGHLKPAMPLGETLPSEQVAILKKWIDAGAAWPDTGAKEAKPASYSGIKTITEAQRRYWAFQKPARALVPRPKNASWVRNPIDAFVLAALEEKGLAPSLPADKRTLLRRVTFDLTGLPPTTAETEAFLSDRSPEAYEKVVRRLLNSPAHGERWAQHWLDVVRFAETNGYEVDADREQAWRYRDYVVRSFNEDKPYDRFILEQIAGDEITPPNSKDAFEMRVATGFLRAGPQHVVAGNQDEAVNRQEWLTEATSGTAATFLGLTIGCARCHDHKFDPIPQVDYYRLQAFFAATDNKTFDNSTTEQKRARIAAMKTHDEGLKPITKQIEEIERPYRERLTEEKRRALESKYKEALGSSVNPCRAKDDGETQAGQAANSTESPTRNKELIKEACRMLSVKWDELVPTLSPNDRARRAALRHRMHELELNAPPPLDAALAVADSRDPVPPIHILRGGDPHAPGEEVRPRFLSVTLRDDAPPEAEPAPLPREVKSTGRRAALARWIAQPGHPLTTRVMMNRLWQRHFGRGIVGTPNDFGRNGQQPTHPELLDWLATEFVARGWSLKAMHEMMVFSNTYQQSSAHDSNKARTDPENHLLWRMNRQRLEAEAVRDAIL